LIIYKSQKKNWQQEMKNQVSEDKKKFKIGNPKSLKKQSPRNQKLNISKTTMIKRKMTHELIV
jgi:hypothetical protein